MALQNRLLERLKKKDKKGYFTPTHTAVSYPTGFLSLDYRNGYMLQCIDDEEQVVDEFPSIGVVGGSLVTVIGKSATAKTTWAIQSSANIVKPFENGMVIHFDLEQALSYTRIKSVTGMTQVELKNKYILKKEKSYIEDITDTIMDIANMKEMYKSEFQYTAPFKNEFNEPINCYVPTIIIIDSVPSMTARPDTTTDKETGAKLEKIEIEGDTYANRNAKRIAQFYKKLIPTLKQYNISIITINHINDKIEINPFAKTQAQVMYLNQNESLPKINHWADMLSIAC